MDFKENEHPRDNDGKFTKGGNSDSAKLDKLKQIYNSDSETYRQNTSHDDLIGLNFFGEKSKSLNQQKNIDPPPKEVYGFANSERLNTGHHKRHSEEMGFKDQKQYEKAAVEFWKNGKGKIYFSPHRDRYYKYDSKKELFISVDIEGIIHTFMTYDIKKFDKKFKLEGLYEI